MYSIGRAAEQVGISAATLRAWEHRYSIVQPQRTAGDYRMYTVEDVRLLRVMKQLIDSGWSPNFAAREAQRRREARSEGPARAATDLPEQFVAAAAALDAGLLDGVLDQMFALASFEAVAMAYLFPALRELGSAWESGQASVAGEHLASHAVERRLSAAYDAAARDHGGPRIVLGLGPGSRHELGLLAFAVAARRRGLSTDFLGADVPVADWVTASHDPSLAAVVLALPTESEVQPANDVIAAIRERAPHLLVAAGGAKEDAAVPGVLRLGPDLASAAQTLAESLSTQPAPARG